MDRLGGFVARRRKLVVGLWVVVLLGSLPFAAQQTKNLTAGGFEAPGSGSLSVSQDLARFPGVQTEPLTIVFDNAGGDAAALRSAVDRAVAEIRGVDNIAVSPQAQAAAIAAADEDIVLLALDVTGGADEAADAATDLRKELDINEQGDAAVPLTLIGPQALWAAMQDVSKEDLERAEGVGFPIVFIILLAVFGSLAAAVLPLGLGFVSVIISGAAIYFLSKGFEMSIFVTNITSMLGIGVAVDYSLFILARYREELAAGADPLEAQRRSLRTSGLAVAFSGVTVIISLAGLFLANSKTMHSMAIGAIIVVAISILGAVTLLPALMQLFGRRVYERGKVVGWVGAQLSRLKPKRAEKAPDAPGFWERWTATLMRRPVLFATLATVVMLVIAIPALSLKWGTGALAQLPADNATRIGFEQAARQAGPGALGPVYVVADYGDAAPDDAALASLTSELRQVPNVAAVAAPLASDDGHAALVVVTPRSGPEDEATLALVKELRAPDSPTAALAPAAVVSIGGSAAQNGDFSDLVSGSLWKILLFVCVCSYLILFVLLRSVILPLKAVLMNLLSVAAAYGVLVAVFQYGWFDSVLNYDHLGYVNAITPALLLVIVFGLSMDYEVFLLSRIKERYLETGDNRTAVAHGLAASAKTISSAAIIMVAVFSVFALTGLPQVKEIGVGLAVAIFLDATLVRLVLVPATMELMGKWNWWVPGWIDRHLPDLDFESSGPAPELQPDPEPAPTVSG